MARNDRPSQQPRPSQSPIYQSYPFGNIATVPVGSMQSSFDLTSTPYESNTIRTQYLSAMTGDLVHRLVHHPLFAASASSVVACLRLDDRIWNQLRALREGTDHENVLQTLHPSIFATPPHEIWVLLVAIRGENYRFEREGIISNVGSSIPYRAMLPSNLPAAHPTSEPSRPLHVSDGPQRLSSDQDSEGSPSATRNRQGPREAPEGWCFQCPSHGCRQVYTRLGHYKNHLNRVHPDFKITHPDHTPEQALTLVSEASQPRSHKGGIRHASSSRPSNVSAQQPRRGRVRSRSSTRQISSMASPPSMSQISYTQSTDSLTNMGDWPPDLTQPSPLSQHSEIEPAWSYAYDPNQMMDNSNLR